MEHNCRQQGCPNRYDDVIGVWPLGKKLSGADCLPCYYAGLMKYIGQSPEDIEQAPELMSTFITHLATMGWTWGQVKGSYARLVTEAW